MIDFSCDYNCGCAKEILEAMIKANGEQNATYGFDKYSLSAKEKIKQSVGNPSADVFFLVGGTQSNATVLSALLAPYEGAVCATTGHIAVHEAGAIELTGHKVLTVEGDAYGKLPAENLENYLKAFYSDSTASHMVQPGVVYLSQPTENGGLYSKAELTAIRESCDRYGLRLYIDGARLAYALGSEKNDVTLGVLGTLADAFTIGGTKCGALLGEAVVFRKPQVHFFTVHKQHGALLAKGFVEGLQFDTLFTNDLYTTLGRQGTACAVALRNGLEALGVGFHPYSETNQQFPFLSNAQLAALDGKFGYEVWSRTEEGAVVRLCTSWRTTMDDVTALLDTLKGA